MTVTASLIPMLSDNYSWLLRESVSGKVAIVDPAEAAPAIAAIEAAGGKLDMILLTHHHADHVDGVPALVAKYRPIVVGNAATRTACRNSTSPCMKAMGLISAPPRRE